MKDFLCGVLSSERGNCSALHTAVAPSLSRGGLSGDWLQTGASVGWLAVPNPLRWYFIALGAGVNAPATFEILCWHKLFGFAWNVWLRTCCWCRSGCPGFGGNYWVFHGFCFNLFRRFLLFPQISRLASRWRVRRQGGRREPRLKARLIFCAIHIAERGWFKAY